VPIRTRWKTLQRQRSVGPVHRSRGNRKARASTTTRWMKPRSSIISPWRRTQYFATLQIRHCVRAGSPDSVWKRNPQPGSGASLDDTKPWNSPGGSEWFLSVSYGHRFTVGWPSLVWCCAGRRLQRHLICGVNNGRMRSRAHALGAGRVHIKNVLPRIVLVARGCLLD